MARRSVKTTPASGISRRDVLRAVAAVPVLPLAALAAQEHHAPGDPPTAKAKPAETPRLKLPRPWWLDARERSRVIDLRSRSVLKGSNVDRIQLRTLLASGLRRLTDEVVVERAWRTILGPARKIVIKFNSVGADVLPGSDTFARVLVDLLADSGYMADEIKLVEAPDFLTTELELKPPAAGWGEPIDVGGKPVDLARWFLDADAVINVGFLKTHRIAGMSGCMKNISHAIIRSPARFHANHCSPAVAEIIGQKVVADRLRLNIVNALHVLVRNGPEAAEADAIEAGIVLLGQDPVAVDRIGLDLLTAERRTAGLEDPVAVPYLTVAGDSGLGRIGSREIEQITLEQ